MPDDLAAATGIARGLVLGALGWLVVVVPIIVYLRRNP